MDNSTGAIVGVLVLVVIAIVGWLAYSQGFFNGAAEEDESGLEINIGTPDESAI